MTAPGSAIPPQPGWWARTDRVGTIDSQYGWAVNVSGLMLPAGTVAAQYGWTASITGLTPTVTYSSTGAGAYDGNGSPSWSHTAAAGDYVVAAISAYSTGDITGVTYDGNAMTYLGRKFRNDASSNGQAVAYGYLDTSGGTKTIAVTRSGTNGAQGSSVGYQHVQSVRCVTTAFESGGSLSHSVALNYPESMAVHLFSSPSSMTPSGGTSRFNSGSGNSYLNISDATTSTTFTATQISGAWSGLSLILTPAPVGNSLYVKGVNLNAADKTSIDIPAHVSGDLIVLGVYRFNSNTLPSKPSASGSVPAWADIDANTGADTNSMRTASFVATGSTHTSGTWTNASGLIAVVLSGQNASPIGGHAESGSTSTQGATAPSTTMGQTNGSSVLLHFLGRRNVSNWAWSAPPAGYSQYGRIDGSAVLSGLCVLMKDTTTSDGSVTNDTDTTSSVGYRGATVEILD